MFTALCRATYALTLPPMRRVVALSLALAVLTFAALWVAVAGVLYNAAFFEWRPLNWLVDLMGGLAVLVLSWLLFPAVVTAIMSFFLERIAAAVEALDYPGRGPPRRQRIGETIAATLRLTGLTLLLNLLALPVFLLGVMIAALFSLPLVNLVSPVIATAFMVHVFEALPRVEPHPPGPHPLTRSVV